MRILRIALFGLVCLAPLGARAQGFDAETFRPAGSTSSAFSQDFAHVLGRGDINAGLTLDYAHDPLVLRDPTTNDIIAGGGVVANRLTGHLGGAYGIGGFLELRASLPVVMVQNGNISTVDMGASLGTAALGDLRLGAKAPLVGKPGRDGFQLALAADLGLPTGSVHDFAGDDSVSFRPRVIAGFEQRGFSGALNAGYAVRRKNVVSAGNLTVNDQFLAGLALGYAVIPHRLWALGESYLSHVLGANDGVRDTPVEAIAGARYALLGAWMLQGGVGFGLTTGAGAPTVRALLTVAYATDLLPTPPPPPPPPLPPPPPAVEKPAPDVDTDGDGIFDRLDKCPTEPEDKDGFEDDDGCPDPDNDKDGVPDVTDKCPNVPEDKDGFEDDDGCPDPDNDKDGFLDPVDKCPNEPETFNGFQDDDGCPDKGAPLAVLTGEKIEIKQQINFASNKSTIKKSSFPLLAVVAKLMSLHPEITKVRVEGHTDNRGSAKHNLKLSQERADSVRAHLVSVAGIEPGRLEAQGFGLTKPIATNKTSKGRAANRRSEFIIVDRAAAPDAAPAGQTSPPAPTSPTSAPPSKPVTP